MRASKQSSQAKRARDEICQNQGERDNNENGSSNKYPARVSDDSDTKFKGNLGLNSFNDKSHTNYNKKFNTNWGLSQGSKVNNCDKLKVKTQAINPRSGASSEAKNIGSQGSTEMEGDPGRGLRDKLRFWEPWRKES